MVADLPAGRVRTDLGDDAGPFVATRERQDARWQVARGEVVIGVAQARRHHLEAELALAGSLHVDVHDLPLARSLSDHRTSCLHDPPLLA